ncbi:prolipoprotein diacylglyceryl transferase [Facklamia sp. 7083-14-GEN3]|uniref:prolipoprotein diacylglyceryl transferase n=1 Tax=Facklamia sp. 7083-14-GEN3 TaxID=2973478 RepID=UPI00215CE5BD|nr:prolipoprotein diacylglyceryl transferase [Facklamia sp. 7083-14-GEN3]MCR8969647.1 prolipoprotein diacylglyceryl transferase [Facklamia sp. 7083-14-GEN3]
MKIDRIAFHIGSWPVYWYGVIIGFGMLLAYVLYITEVKRKGVDPDKAFDRLFWAIIIGFIGARIYYVAFSWESYQDNLMNVFAIWNGGIAIYGGIIAGFLTLMYFIRKEKLNPALEMDMAAPALMLAQIVGRWGNFINQEAYGGIVSRSYLENLKLPTFIIEQMKVQGQYRQPTFLFESLWNFVGLILIIIIRRKRFLKEGEVAGFYAVWYGIGRAWIEGLRTDSLYWGPFRVSQVFSLIIVVTAISIMVYRRIHLTLPLYKESDIER